MTDASTASSLTSRLASDWPWRVALAVVVVVLFGRLAAYDFTLWDDQSTIHRNPLLNPPTLQTLRYYWTTPEQGLYVPVTWTVWAALAMVGRTGAIDDVRASLNPWIYHGANVGLHLVCSVLVFGLLRRLLPRTPAWAAFLGAAVFAVHPLQVESVAWISGMKDLLCWTFFLLALRSYLIAVTRDRDAAATQSVPRLLASRPMLLAGAYFVLAFFSKPTAMVFPAAAVTVDLLLVGRPWRRVAMTVAPFAVAAAGFAAIARVAQTVTYNQPAPLWSRPFIALDSLAFYLGKLVWPTGLTIDYGRTPQSVLSTPGWWTTSLVAPAVAVALLALWVRFRNPALLAAPMLFVIGILPVLGLATFQMQQYSTVTDHYVYFSMVGVGLLVADLLGRSRTLRPAAIGVTSVAIVAVACAALAVRTWIAVPAWATSETLYLNAVRVRPDSWLAHNNLGSFYNDLRRFDEAEPRFRESIRLNADNTLPYMNLAGVLLARGDDAGAREAYRGAELATERQPRVDNLLRGLTQYQIAEGFLGARLWDDAIRHADRGLEFMPGNARLLDLRSRAIRARELDETRRAATRPSTQAAQ